MTTPRAVATELDQLFTYLESRGIVYFWNVVDETSHRVSWCTTGNLPFLTSHEDLAVGDYLYWLRNGMYSAVLRDGALIQLTYHFEGNSIVAHRLAYVPCPVLVDQELLEEGFAIADVVELQMADANQIKMKSMIRFDYDPKSVRERHPETHLTMNSVDCRVACLSPLRVGRFIDFIFRHFYPVTYQQDPYIQAMPRDGWFKNTLVDDDRNAIHISWAR